MSDATAKPVRGSAVANDVLAASGGFRDYTDGSHSPVPEVRLRVGPLGRRRRAPVSEVWDRSEYREQPSADENAGGAICAVHKRCRESGRAGGTVGKPTRRVRLILCRADGRCVGVVLDVGRVRIGGKLVRVRGPFVVLGGRGSATAPANARGAGSAVVAVRGSSELWRLTGSRARLPIWPLESLRGQITAPDSD